MLKCTEEKLISVSIFPSVCILHHYRTIRKHLHDDFVKWRHFPRYWSFVRGLHLLPVNSPHKDQWRGDLMISCLNKRLSKQSWSWWFKTPSLSLWRYCNERAVSSSEGHEDTLYSVSRVHIHSPHIIFATGAFWRQFDTTSLFRPTVLKNFHLQTLN